MKIDFELIHDEICDFFYSEFKGENLLKFFIVFFCVLFFLFFFPFHSDTFSTTAEIVGYKTVVGDWHVSHDYVVVSCGDDNVYKIEDTKLYSNSSVGDTIGVSFVVQKNAFGCIVRKYVDYSSYEKEF